MKVLFICLIALFSLLSLIAFCVYGADKAKAKKGAWRIPEKVLLSLSFFGGGLGGLLGMFLFRHKTNHFYFWVINILGLIWQAGIIIFIAYKLYI